MLSWSKKYNIGNELVDEEHQRLFVLLKGVSDDISTGEKSTVELEAALDHLLEYANQHFVHEEELMESHHVDERHVRRQQMEHKSFLYDIGKLRKRSVDEKIQDRYERMVQFVTAWLVFHTLKTDQLLGFQLKEIADGIAPEEAYRIAMEKDLSAALYRPIIEALIHLWSDAANRVTHLEQVVEALGPKDEQ